jgi:hypothetical protein
MVGSFFLDKWDPGSWRPLNGLALKVSAAAEGAGPTRAVVELLQLSALQWCAISMNAFNRVSVLSGHPVRPRPSAGFSSDGTRPASWSTAGELS